MKIIIRIILPIFIILSVTDSIYSQDRNNAESLESNSQFADRLAWVNKTNTDIHEVNFIAGHSFTSTKGFWGKIPKATLSIYTVRYNRKLVTYNSNHLLEYVVEANLAANYSLSDTPGYKKGSFGGFGVAPIGFQFNFNSNNRLQPFFKSSAGFMYFKKSFPDQRGTQFNFTLELGGGIEVMVWDNISLSAGYKYHHMSNGQFGQINPGVDSNIFYTGFTIF